MPRYIIKLPGERYLEWSTVTDAPNTYGMSREEFEAWWIAEYGRSQSHRLPRLMERVEATGTSEENANLRDTIAHNRAGEDEKTLTLRQVIAEYAYPPHRSSV